MFEILSRAVALVLVVGTGYGMKRIGWVKASDFPIFSKLVLRVTLPAALITSFNDFVLTSGLLVLVVIGFTANFIQESTAWFVSRRKHHKTRGFAILHGGTYNIGAFLLPYVSAFMGHQSVVYASLFDIGNAVSGAGTGYAWGLSASRGAGQRLSLLDVVRLLARNVIFMTYLSLLLMRVLGLHLPATVITFTSLVGAANPFLAMLMIGVGLEIRLPGRKYWLAARFLLLRYAFSTVFSLISWFWLPLDRDVRVVLVMIFFAPIASMISGFTEEAEGDVELAAFMSSVTIIIGIVAMPVIFLSLGNL